MLVQTPMTPSRSETSKRDSVAFRNVVALGWHCLAYATAKTSANMEHHQACNEVSPDFAPIEDVDPALAPESKVGNHVVL